MQPDNVIMGDSTGIELPRAIPVEEDLSAEKNRAKFSKTKEWKQLKEHLEARVEFYQHMLPNGQEIALDVTPTPEDWMVANRVIGELKLIISTYEGTAKVIDES